MTTGAFSDRFEAHILNWFKGVNMTSAPSVLFLGLFNTLPSDEGTAASSQDGTEISGNNYARVMLTTASAFGAISPASNSTGQLISLAQIATFPQASGSWGTVNGYGYWDNSSGGNLLFYSPISASQAISANQNPSFSVGDAPIVVD